jgi:hypothetical protein
MNKGYMLYIQSCAKFWRQTDPETVKIKQELTALLPQYSFLGICGVMWGFLSQAKRNWWNLETYKNPTRWSILLSTVKSLALLTSAKLAA